MVFDLFGVDVLARAEDDDFFLSAGNKEVAVTVEVAKIAGTQPSVMNGFGGCRWTVVVAWHHDAAGNGDFADRITDIFNGLRIEDPDLHAFERLAHRAQHVVRGRRGG